MKSHKYEIMDCIRGLAALSVMIYHVTQRSDFPIFQNANIAVDLFFIMSGFVIAHSYTEKLETHMGAGTYLYKRLVRIYPLFLAGLILGAIAAFASGTIVSDILRNIAFNLFYLPDVTHVFARNASSGLPDNSAAYPLNDPSWSLFFEMVASVLFIFLYRLKTSQLKAIALFSFIAVFIHGLWIATLFDKGVYMDFSAGWSFANFFGGFPRVLYGFTLGMIFYRLRDRFEPTRLIATWQKIPANQYLLCVGIVLTLLFPKLLYGWYFILATATVIPVAMILAAFTFPRNKSELGFCKFMGELSFPLYCLHMPVLYLSELIFPSGTPDKTSAAASLTAMVSSIIVSYVALKIYDEPLRAFLTSRNKRKGSTSFTT